MSIILQIWYNFYAISLQVLTKKPQNTRRVYQDLQPQRHTIPDIFKTLVYSESWHIQSHSHTENPGISKTLAHSEPKIYSEPWAIQNPEIYSEPCQRSKMEHFEKQITATIILGSYNYFNNITFSCPLVH